MPKELKIKSLTFHASDGKQGPPLEVATGSVTVLVGPNNSGKSETLREIESWCGGIDGHSSVIKNIELSSPDTFDEFLDILEPFIISPPELHQERQGYFWVSKPSLRDEERAHAYEMKDSAAREEYTEHRGNSRRIRHDLVSLFTMRLDGRTRFELLSPKKTGPLRNPPQNLLAKLFEEDTERERLRQFTEAVLGLHFVIDPTDMIEYKVRLSSRKPQSVKEEKALDAEAQEFHHAATLIENFGDGVQCAVGLIAAVSAMDQRIWLIDEPEGFLHPVLARETGRFLAAAARDRNATLIVATHNADFLFGCVQAIRNLRIVRLTYNDSRATAHTIEPAQVLKMMNDPLLRSTNLLRALFFRGVVVTEADADRALYDEVNYRLLSNGEGIENVTFLNAQNWQTIPRLVKPLRTIGVAAASIMDFDVLMSKEFKRLWNLVPEPEPVLNTLREQRKKVCSLLEQEGRDNCKKLGLRAFSGKDRELVERFVEQLAQYGLFFVTVGELECWFSYLGIAKHSKKAIWLNELFDKLAANQEDENYIESQEGDIWDFLRKIGDWIDDPNRNGMHP